jgi:hypothetical protein
MHQTTRREADAVRGERLAQHELPGSVPCHEIGPVAVHSLGVSRCGGLWGSGKTFRLSGVPQSAIYLAVGLCA